MKGEEEKALRARIAALEAENERLRARGRSREMAEDRCNRCGRILPTVWNGIGSVCLGHEDEDRIAELESALAAALERIDELSFPKEYIQPGPEREAALKNLRASADARLPLPARVPEMPPVKPPLVSDDAGRVERVREAILGYGLARQVICEDVRFTQPMTKESAAELARAVLAAADGREP